MPTPSRSSLVFLRLLSMFLSSLIFSLLCRRRSPCVCRDLLFSVLLIAKSVLLLVVTLFFRPWNYFIPFFISFIFFQYVWNFIVSIVIPIVLLLYFLPVLDYLSLSFNCFSNLFHIFLTHLPRVHYLNLTYSPIVFVRLLNRNFTCHPRQSLWCMRSFEHISFARLHIMYSLVRHNIYPFI